MAEGSLKLEAILAPDLPEWIRETVGGCAVGTREDGDRQGVAEATRELAERSIPVRFRGSRFGAELAAKVARRQAIAEAGAALRRPGGITLVGQAGSGKTSLLVALVRAAATTGRRCLFVPAYRLGQARIQHLAGHGEAPDVLEAQRIEILALDDLGAERDTSVNPIADVIFERHNENRATWVTTGLTEAQLRGRYGAGVVRRLFDGAVVIRTSEAEKADPGRETRAPKPGPVTPAQFRRSGDD
jgi:hypothetical protein